MSGRKPDQLPSVTAEETRQRLSQRQRDIAGRYASGLTYKQIAAELFISPATVRNHLATIYRELGISNKAGLIRWRPYVSVA